jgi:rSAM/selenodomain-associated transferase 1
MSVRDVLGLFAKWPAPGAVKTRLTADPARAAAVARAFLDDTVARLTALPCRRVLAFAPDAAGADFAELAAGRFDLVPQGDGDLGCRMKRFVADRLSEGAERVVLVGADCPTLPVEYVESAFTELATAEVVLGPAADGGYYLLGCARRVPPVFDGVPWGTADVLRATVARLAGHPGRLALLPIWYDVDTPDDWALLRGHVAALRRAGVEPGVPHTEALL